MQNCPPSDIGTDSGFDKARVCSCSQLCPFCYARIRVLTPFKRMAVGTSGSEISVDDVATWKPLNKEKYNSVAFIPTGDGWAVGPNGRIAKFVKADK